MASINLDHIFEGVSPTFSTYSDFCPKADAMNVYFRNEPDYSERLNAHITLFRSLADKSLVGFRLKGIKELKELTPNWLQVDHENIKLRIIFFAFVGNASEDERRVLKELTEKVGEMPLESCDAAA